MSIVNILINDHILNIRYPLTIAGMTGRSIGATCVQAHTEDNELIKFKDEQRKPEM